MWPGQSVLPDFARDDVRTWWAGLHRVHVDAGVRGVLADMNEPSLRDRPIDDPAAERAEVPADVGHGDPAERASHAEVHNLYGTLHARATAEGLRRLRPDERALVLSRSGFAGIQRYAGVWAGDNWSAWEHLQLSLAQAINLGLSGVALTGADIGGFFGHCTPELLARWTQVGAFYPLMRANGARDGTAQEPWVWGDDVESTCRRAIELRYQLLPYLYSLFAESARTGAPVLRPLWWADPTDAATRTAADTALLGDALLVAPVLWPGKSAREVYLPAGRWWDWRGGPCQPGGGSVLVSARLDEPPPLFARGGTIVPTGPVMQWSDERPVDPLVVHVFPDAAGAATGELYEDDGHSYAYEHGASSVAHFRYRDETLTMQRTGPYAPRGRRTRVVVHCDDGNSVEHDLGWTQGGWELRC